MASPQLISMSMQEVNRLRTIQLVIDGNLRASTAAQRLQLTKRQVNRLVQRYRQEGAAGLISRQRGQPGHRRLLPDLRTVVLTIIRQRYADFGPTLACEKLCELHGIEVAKETLRLWMMDAGLWIPRKLRSPTVYQPRNRRHCVGELVQIDGSDHAWCEDRVPPCTLLVFIDDATSRLMQLHFTYSESTFSYFDAIRAYLERHGKPQAFYSDKASIFRVNQKQATSGNGYTQLGRALYELNIESLCANTSQAKGQAKGRVERANLTLQDRLVKELRLQEISTMAATNAYAPSFIADYNRSFAKPARNDFNAHRPIRHDENLNLIFTVRESRRVLHSLAVQYDKVLYLLADTPDSQHFIGKYIEVYDYPDGRIEPRADGRALHYATYDRLPHVSQGAVVDNQRLGHVLQIARLVQEQRESRRGSSAPSRNHRGLGFCRIKRGGRRRPVDCCL
jgi:transposase